MTDSIRSYRELHVWGKAMTMAKEVYQVTAHFPAEERFGLVAQMRRAAVSIPSNLAEGHARLGVGEFQHGVSIALGSVAELETQVILSADLGYLKPPAKDDLLSDLDAVGKMLRGLQRSLSERKARLRSA